ncbi:MAG: 23S rRNA (pseudouridine(1915)-N(3))-methyltransferase RlmH [Alphaproteobacteria bacterium]|nr:23S rRNA (pseudouridine(1915)-N(3))-methyltransferase RlmH [Alphaproteobacteria bacterium]
MRIAIVAVGRARQGAVQAMVADYAKRLPWPLAIHEVEAPAKLAGAERMRREAALLADRIPGTSALVALDRRGKALSSEDFAARLGAWRDEGRDLAFLIGGADGLDPGLLRRASLTLSFGPMVWPHMLARVMLAEQLWRAAAILAGHPYHRGD